MSLALKRKDKKAGVAPETVDGQPVASGPSASAMAGASGLLAGLTKPRRGRSFGVDIDGNVARVVEVLGNAVVSFGTYQGESSEDAFRKFLATRPNGDVTVSWNGSNMHVVRTTVPNVPASAMRAGLLDQVDESLPMAAGNATLAARMYTNADGSAGAVLAAVERDAASDLWEAIGSADVALVPAPLLFTQNGLYLGVRYSDTQLTLVQNGAVLTARPLGIGGLTSMFDKLGGDPTRAPERFATVARGGTRLDPDAAAVVDAYSATIGEEVRRTVDFWARQGHTVPSEVFVHGPGIVLPNLSGKLLDAALFARPVALPDVSVEAIARTERPTAFLALQAALLDYETQPLADLPDPRHADRAKKKKATAKKTLTVILAAATVSAGILAYFAPVLIAKGLNGSAKSRYNATVVTYNTWAPQLQLKAKVDAGQKAYNESVKNELAWDQIYKAILASPPTDTGAAIQGISISPSGNSLAVSFSGTMQGEGFDKTVVLWVERLKKLGSTNPWPSAFNTVVSKTPITDPRAATESITVTFSVPIPLDAKDPVTGQYLAQREIVAVASPAASGTKTTGPATPATTAKANS